MKKNILSMIIAATFSIVCVFSVSSEITQTIDVAEMIADKENWTGTWTFDDTRVSETTIGDDYIELAGRNIKSATNPQFTGQNFRLDYKLTVTWPEDAYDWGSVITFHDKEVGVHVWEQGRNATYGVFYKLDSSIEDVTKAGSISIAKWNQPVTHNGDPEGLGDDAVISGLDLSGKENIYNLFVEDVTDGVHMMLYMNGALIIDVTDTGTVKNEIDSPPITGDGGFMIMQHAPRSVVFSVVKASEQPELQTPSPSPTIAVSSQASSAASSAAVSSDAGSTISEQVSEEDSSQAESSLAQSSEETSSTETESSLSQDTSSAISQDEETGGISTGLIIGIAVLVILGAGAAGAIMIIKKKRS